MRQALCASGLTQEEAGALVGIGDRQVRKWLKRAPKVVELLAELEALAGRRAA